MKKLSLLIASILSIAACTKVEVDDQTIIPSDKSYMAYFDNSDSKVHLNDSIKSIWDANDHISIFETTTNAEYKLSGESGGNRAIFVPVGSVEGGSALSTNYAVYPYNSSTFIATDGTITLSLPSVQAYAENSYGIRANTMVAATENSQSRTLDFKSLGGYVVVKLYGEGKVTSVVFEGNNGEKIAGIATVKPEYGSMPSVAVSDSGTYSISVDCGEGVQLGTTAETATEFWFVVPPVTFEKGFTVKAYNDKGYYLEKSTSLSRTITRNKIHIFAAIKGQFKPKVEAIDLGLSVKWASFNVGAAKPEDYGNHYAWGEINAKSIYDYTNYNWCNGTSTSLTKYCTSSNYGTVDNKTILEFADDVANTEWGGQWRMPTFSEWEELINNCDYESTVVNGVNGKKFTSKKNGNNIFLPSSGYYEGDVLYNQNSKRGYYWSSSLSLVSGSACFLDFRSSSVSSGMKKRCYGLSVRPILDDTIIPVTSVTLDKTTVSIQNGQTLTLTATVNPSDATEKTITWATSDASVATVSEGVVTAIKAGSVTITATAGNKTAACSVTVVPVIEAIDLGLSVSWANWNLGANSESGYGDFYAWGETSPKTTFSWANYTLCKGTYTTLTKYNKDSSYGTVDNKTRLESTDDAATVKLGSSWHIPTLYEWNELKNNCTWTWTTEGGVNGYRVTSNKSGYTDKSIFLPIGGGYDIYNTGKTMTNWGLYWTSDLHDYVYSWAYGYNFTSDSSSIRACLPDRSWGYVIRAVQKK